MPHEKKQPVAKKAVAAAAAFVVAFARDQNAIELLVRMRRGRRDELLDNVERFCNNSCIVVLLSPFCSRIQVILTNFKYSNNSEILL